MLVAVAVCRLDTMWTGVCCFGCKISKKNLWEKIYHSPNRTEIELFIVAIECHRLEFEHRIHFLSQLKQLQSVKMQSKLIFTEPLLFFGKPNMFVAAGEKSCIWHMTSWCEMVCYLFRQNFMFIFHLLTWNNKVSLKLQSKLNYCNQGDDDEQVNSYEISLTIFIIIMCSAQ